jgi:hypothetical protein
MSFNPSFTAKQLYATPRILRVTDTSISSGSTFSSTFDNTFFEVGYIGHNKVYLRKDDGTYLVPKGVNTDYIEWVGTPYIDIDVLDKDYALEIKVEFNIYFYPNIFDITFTDNFN